MSVGEEPASESGAAEGSHERQLDFHPGMEMRWEITRSTTDTGGELFEATNWVGAQMAGPPVHVHPTAEESYEVIEGALDVFVDGEWRTLRAGETATAPAASRIRFETPPRSRSASSTSTVRRCSSSRSSARCTL